MADRLHGIVLKIERARAHAREVERLIKDFSEDAFESVRHQCKVKTGEHVFVLEEVRRPDNDTIGLLLSEFLHNARSALDNLAWQLVHHPSVKPRGGKAADDVIAFPLCDSPTWYAGAVKKKLRGAAPGVETVVETLQPYYRGKDALFEGQNALWLLQEANNWDKHRLLHIVENELYDAYFGQEHVCEAVTYRAPGRLETHAELLAYKLRPGADPQMDVEFAISTGVTFDDGPAAGRIVIKLNAEILLGLKKAVERLRPFVLP